MKIDIKWLKEIKACDEAIIDFQKNWPKAIKDTRAIERLIKENKLDWANWLVVRVMAEY